MARSYYTDGTSALNMSARALSSNVISFERHVPDAKPSRCESICQHVFRGEPCAHELYSFKNAPESSSDKVKSLIAVVVPALAMFLAIVGPALF